MNDFFNTISPTPTPTTTPTPGVNVNISNPTIPQTTNQTSPLNTLFTSAILTPRHQVRRVNDEREIYSIPMGVDSNDFVLHNQKPLIYFVATDNTGNKTSVIPFEIKQYVPEPEPTMQDVKAVEDRVVEMVEERLSGFEKRMAELVSGKLEEALN